MLGSFNNKDSLEVHLNQFLDRVDNIPTLDLDNIDFNDEIESFFCTIDLEDEHKIKNLKNKVNNL